MLDKVARLCLVGLASMGFGVVAEAVVSIREPPPPSVQQMAKPERSSPNPNNGENNFIQTSIGIIAISALTLSALSQRQRNRLFFWFSNKLLQSFSNQEIEYPEKDSSGSFESYESSDKESKYSEDSDDSQMKSRCITCWENIADHIVDGCYHLCLCEECSPRIQELGRCPICNRRLHRNSIHKVYDAGTVL